MVFLIWTGLVEAGMLVVGCARRVENIEKLASQLTQHTGKVTNFCSFNPVIFVAKIMLNYTFYSHKTNLAKSLPNFAT
jgi:hypothetical protein